MKPHTMLRIDHESLSVILKSLDFTLGALVCGGGDHIMEDYNQGNDIKIIEFQTNFLLWKAIFINSPPRLEKPPSITHQVSKDNTLALKTQPHDDSPISPYLPLSTYAHFPPDCHLLPEASSVTVEIRSRVTNRNQTRTFLKTVSQFHSKQKLSPNPILRGTSS